MAGGDRHPDGSHPVWGVSGVEAAQSRMRDRFDRDDLEQAVTARLVREGLVGMRYPDSDYLTGMENSGQPDVDPLDPQECFDLGH